MPTIEQFHRNLETDFEFKMSARHGFGSEHADHISTRAKKRLSSPPTYAMVFNNFLGNWDFKREMFSSENELQSSATGIAVFSSPEEDVMFYKETGTGIYTNNHENEFSKEYKYRLYSNSIDVYLHGGHDHGNHYQTYLLNASGNELRSMDNHVCKSDVYNSFYELLDENNFTLTTQMNGPRKNSIIKTVFKRSI